MYYVRMMCVTIVIIATVFSIGHADTDQIEDIKAYFPMITGSIWTYDDATGATDTIEITSCSKENEDVNVCTFLEETSRIGSKPSYCRYAFRDGSLFILSRKIKDKNWQVENSMILKSPLKIADMWEVISRNDQITKYRVVDILPTMQVRAGTFNNVIMIEQRLFIKGKPRAIRYDYYAPNAGLIGIGGKPDANGKLLKELRMFRPGSTGE